MTAIPMGLMANKRTVARFPETVLQNFVVEKDDANLGRGVSLISRPGLEAFAELAAGPIRGFLQVAGVFDGDALVVSNTMLYRINSAGAVTPMVGAVPGTGRVSIAATAIAGVSTARIANGDGVYICDGTSVTTEAFPDDAGVQAVAVLKGFWFAIRTDTQQVYSREPGGTVWDALAFTSAEAEPDSLVGFGILGDLVGLFGTASLEYFSLTGTANPAIQPIAGLRFDRGCRNRDTIVQVGNVLAFVGDDCEVYTTQTTPIPVSEPGLSEQIRLCAASELRAWSCKLDTHEYYILSLGETATYALDLTTKKWSRWRSLGYDHFRGHLGASLGSTVLAGDTESGAIWRLSPEQNADVGDNIIRVATGLVPQKEGYLFNAMFRAFGVVGFGDDDDENLAQLRWSDNDGKTWSAWKQASLGELGEYGTRLIWRRLGRIKPPGRIYQLRDAHKGPSRYSDFRDAA